MGFGKLKTMRLPSIGKRFNSAWGVAYGRTDRTRTESVELPVTEIKQSNDSRTPPFVIAARERAGLVNLKWQNPKGSCPLRENYFKLIHHQITVDIVFRM